MSFNGFPSLAISSSVHDSLERWLSYSQNPLNSRVIGCKDVLKGLLSGFNLTRMRTILIACWVITLILLFRHQSVLQSARSKQRQKEYDFGHEFAKRHWLRSQLKYRTRRSIAKNVCLEENSPSLEHKHLYCHWIIIIPVTNCAWSVSRPYAWECGEDSGWDTRKAVKWQWTNLSQHSLGTK